MSRINEAIHSIHYLDYVAMQDKWLNRLHPLAKTIVTFSYIFVLLSFPKYELLGVLTMIFYPIITFLVGRLSLGKSIRQLRIVILLVCAVGIANPLLDREIVAHIGMLPVSGGMISMATLMMKGIFSVLASYLLIATTSMEQICYGLRRIHMPKTLVTIILLIYRYIVLMLKEVERIMQAYEMRAPGQKGVHVKTWGSLVGQLLLRSIDRAQLVYESMQLRGFEGEYRGRTFQDSMAKSVLYVTFWLLAILALRYCYM